jgi:hypothetical protein
MDDGGGAPWVVIPTAVEGSRRHPDRSGGISSTAVIPTGTQ